MQLIVERNRLVVETENDQDLAFVEDTLGMKDGKDWVKVYRIALENASKGCRLIIRSNT